MPTYNSILMLYLGPYIIDIRNFHFYNIQYEFYILNYNSVLFTIRSFRIRLKKFYFVEFDWIKTNNTIGDISRIRHHLVRPSACLSDILSVSLSTNPFGISHKGKEWRFWDLRQSACLPRAPNRWECRLKEAQTASKTVYLSPRGACPLEVSLEGSTESFRDYKRPGFSPRRQSVGSVN